jgi:hypothetical protein
MNPVRKALATVMKEDKPLMALATGGVHYKMAPQGTVPPYVIFFKSSGIPDYAFRGYPIDQDVWLIKGVGESTVAEDIDKRLKEILDGADLTIEGKAHQDLRHISDVDFDEVVNGERIDHVGAEYKLDSEYQ